MSPHLQYLVERPPVHFVRRFPLTALSAASVAALVVATTGYAVLAQPAATPQPGASSQPATPPIYDPYPPDILPPDLESEIERILREGQAIFNEALAEWRSFPPPTLTGQPPTLQGTGYQSVVVLGKLLNFDQNMSPFRNEFCSFCHMPYVAFSGPIPSVNLTMIA
jgi:cytochrome c peroxidase